MSRSVDANSFTIQGIIVAWYRGESDEGVNVRGEGIRFGVRGRGTRVSDQGYEGVRSGVRGYQIRDIRLLVPGMRIYVPGYEGVLYPGYEGIRSGVRGC